MKKLMYLLIGVASVIIYKAVVESPVDEGVEPRHVPHSFDGALSVEDEIAVPLSEV